VSHLVKIRHLQVGTLAYLAFVRLKFTQDELQQGGFSRTVRTNQPDLVTAQDRGTEFSNNGLVAKCLANPGQLGNDFSLVAVLRTRSDIHLDAAHNISPRLATSA
jgi:hypothetical protein